MKELVELIQNAPILPTVYPTSAETLCRYADVLYEEGYPALELLARPSEQALAAHCLVSTRCILTWEPTAVRTAR